MRRGIALAALALGCARPEPAPPPKTALPKVEIPEAVATSEPEPLTTEPPVALAEVTEPKQVACRIAEAGWAAASLRLRAGGVVFAKVTNAPTTLVVPAGAPAAATAVLDDQQVLVKGIVDKDELRFHPRVALVFAQFLIPKPRVKLAWLSSAAGKLRFGIDTGLRSPERAEDDLPCEKLGLNLADFDARAMLTKQAKLPEKVAARDDVELSDTRGGPVLARLAAGERVEVVQVQGKHSKILIDASEHLVFGWVASADLAPPGAALGYGTGYGRLGGSHYTLLRGRTCARDLTLIVEIGDERAKVGTLRKGAQFEAQTPPEPADTGEPPPRRGRAVEQRFVSVRLLRSRWLSLDEKARLLVPEDEYKECTPPRPP